MLTEFDVTLTALYSKHDKTFLSQSTCSYNFCSLWCNTWEYDERPPMHLKPANLCHRIVSDARNEVISMVNCIALPVIAGWPPVAISGAM